MATIRIPLHSIKYPGLYALIDEADAELASQYRWGVYRRWHSYYARTTRRQDGYKHLHHVLMGLPDDSVIDHINGDGLDNRRENLRIATNSQNGMNQRIRSDNVSGYKGVSWNRALSKWRCQIRVQGKTKHLGYFTDPVEAASVYDREARSLHGDFATLNFPNPTERAARNG